MFLKSASTATPILRISTNVQKMTQKFEGGSGGGGFEILPESLPSRCSPLKIDVKICFNRSERYSGCRIISGKVEKVAETAVFREV